jgi:hypothetical protein
MKQFIQNVVLTVHYLCTFTGAVALVIAYRKFVLGN